jgi:hypothetical protein
MSRNIKKKRRSASVSAKIPWPVRIAICESAIRKQDEYIFKKIPRFVDLVVAATKSRVYKLGKTDSLESLCDEGCPQRELLYLLGMCENRGVSNAFEMTGFDSRELPKELMRIRECASTIYKLNLAEFGMFLIKPGNRTLFTFRPLALVLRQYSALVEHAVNFIGGKSDFYLSLAKALLVEFVHERTKEFHHAKVANLLTVKLGLGYSEVDHRNWRSKYLRRRKGYRPDPADSEVLRMKKNLMEVRAATFYRTDTLHPFKQHHRKQHRRKQGHAKLRPQ